MDWGREGLSPAKERIQFSPPKAVPPIQEGFVDEKLSPFTEYKLPAPLQSETILPHYTEALVVSIEGLQNASTLPLSHA